MSSNFTEYLEALAHENGGYTVSEAAVLVGRL